MFPRIPNVPLVALETVLKKDQVTCGTPLTKVYPRIPMRRSMEILAQP